MQIIQKPSPHFEDRKNNATPSMLVLHYTGMKSCEDALNWLCDPTSKLSCHYVVDEDGTLYQLVDESRRAYHAGISYWRGITDVNSASIGIEIVNPGHAFGYRPFPDAQMHSVIALSREIIKRYNMLPQNIVGHSDVAPARKQDPGELFDWQKLAENGVGLWPDEEAGLILPPLPLKKLPDATPVQQQLRGIGYGIDVTGQWDDQTKAVITAFQRRFCPARLDGIADTMTLQRIALVFNLFQ